MKYLPYTQYEGFSTGRVEDYPDGTQVVWIDNGDHWAVVQIQGTQSELIRAESKL
jgi:hypothetical protein